MEKTRDRKQDILEALMQMLEEDPGGKITTAGLARQLNLSEAALYRHFPSKAKMFDGLLDFAEQAIFSKITEFSHGDHSKQTQCLMIVEFMLLFAERNPGICRLLVGDALIGEHERLKKRSAQIMVRLETELKQLLRQAAYVDNNGAGGTVNTTAALCVDLIDGKILGFVRSGFERKPTALWPGQREQLVQALFS